MKTKLPLIFSLAFAAMLASATAQAQVYTAFLDGPSEDTPNASPGTGFARVTLDLAIHAMRVEANFSDLVGTSTNAHVHAPTAVAFTGAANIATQTPTFTGFPSGVMSGSYNHLFDTLDAATWNPSYITANGGTAAGAEAAFAQALADGKAYFNIHSSAFPGGEIRGFLVVPEPATVSLIVIGGLGLLFAARRARRS